MTTAAKSFLDQAVGTLVQNMPVEEIWLFGSQATGHAGADSDVDLLVVLDDQHGLLRPAQRALQVLRPIRQSQGVDLVAIPRRTWQERRSRPVGIYSDILQHGTRIYARQN
jgi:predicted nucleotidyltransferase